MRPTSGGKAFWQTCLMSVRSPCKTGGEVEECPELRLWVDSHVQDTPDLEEQSTAAVISALHGNVLPPSSPGAAQWKPAHPGCGPASPGSQSHWGVRDSFLKSAPGLAGEVLPALEVRAWQPVFCLTSFPSDPDCRASA